MRNINLKVARLLHHVLLALTLSVINEGRVLSGKIYLLSRDILS